MKSSAAASKSRTVTDGSNAERNSESPLTGWRALRWWPAAIAIAFAAYVARDMFQGSERGHELASIVAASALVYLGAAALQKPSTAWWIFLGTFVVITPSKMGLIGFDATWPLLGLAGLFFGYGLVRGAARSANGLPLQAFAMIAFGTVASAALYVDEVIGAYLVAAGLLAHAGWDAYHHWKNKVVSRSMAEFCFVLDVALAAAIVVATMRL